MKKFSSLLIIAAGTLWGMMGIFVNEMGRLGFSSIQTACLRVTVAAAAMIITILISGRQRMKVHIKDLFLFIILGCVCIFGMSLLYFYTIVNTSLSTAAILLYTSPIWVIIISAIFFREKITWQKLTALVLAFSGCVMVSRFGGVHGIRPVFFITGLASGLAYGLYSIFGTMALRKYHPYTVTAYAFIFAAVSAWIISSPHEIISNIAAYQNKPYLFLMITATGIVTAYAPFMLYTLGLKNTPPGKAAIIACVEPLVATVIGFFMYNQIPSVTGILLIVLAILIVNNFGIKPKKGL